MDTFYTNQISQLTTQMEGISGMLNSICCETITGDELTQCINKNKTLLQGKMDRLQTQKTMFETMLSTFQTGWTSDRATVISEIESLWPGQYTSLFNRMLISSTEEDKNLFFTAYSQAINNFQKQQLIIATFNL